MKNQITAAEILKDYNAEKQISHNLEWVIEAIHPFYVSRIAQFGDSDLDHDYVKRFMHSKVPFCLLGEASTAPASRVSPLEKAKAWIHYIVKKHIDIEHCLARLVAMKVPGFENFRNLSSDCFHEIIHTNPQTFRVSGERAKSRTDMESFLRGTDTSPASFLAFLRAARKDPRNFCAREMFLYACAHCRSVKRFAFVVKNLKPKLGKANFMDVLGYSPFFYVAFGHVQYDVGKFAKWLVEGDGRLLCDVIRKAGGRPECKCRYGFTWKDLEIAAAAIAAESGGEVRANDDDDKMDPFFIPTAGPEPLPVPSSASDIRQLLIDDPDRGVAAILAMDYEPASLENPFGLRERILSDAICDRSIPKPTRVRLLRLCEDSHFAGLPPLEAKGEVPIGFLDSKAGRRWVSESGRPGCEFVRCSHPTFFKRVQIYDGYGRLDGVKLESSVKKAIAEDSPSQLMMPLSVAGKSVDTRQLSILLYFRKKRILEWLIENDEIISRASELQPVYDLVPKYGFILRYLKGKEKITGYPAEPWHIRYLGDPEIAAEITARGITLEEYCEQQSLSATRTGSTTFTTTAPAGRRPPSSFRVFVAACAKNDISFAFSGAYMCLSKPFILKNGLKT